MNVNNITLDASRLTVTTGTIVYTRKTCLVDEQWPRRPAAARLDRIDVKFEVIRDIENDTIVDIDGRRGSVTVAIGHGEVYRSCYCWFLLSLLLEPVVRISKLSDGHPWHLDIVVVDD
jgi:sporulation protein YlmC with PRC-barrel domain